MSDIKNKIEELEHLENQLVEAQKEIKQRRLKLEEKEIAGGLDGVGIKDFQWRFGAYDGLVGSPVTIAGRLAARVAFPSFSFLFLKAYGLTAKGFSDNHANKDAIWIPDNFHHNPNIAALIRDISAAEAWENKNQALKTIQTDLEQTQIDLNNCKTRLGNTQKALGAFNPITLKGVTMVPSEVHFFSMNGKRIHVTDSIRGHVALDFATTTEADAAWDLLFEAITGETQ